MSRVQLASDAYLVCLHHALTTEGEEVMGLLVGEFSKVLHMFFWFTAEFIIAFKRDTISIHLVEGSRFIALHSGRKH